MCPSPCTNHPSCSPKQQNPLLLQGLLPGSLLSEPLSAPPNTSRCFLCLNSSSSCSGIQRMSGRSKVHPFTVTRNPTHHLCISLVWRRTWLTAEEAACTSECSGKHIHGVIPLARRAEHTVPGSGERNKLGPCFS